MRLSDLLGVYIFMRLRDSCKLPMKSPVNTAQSALQADSCGSCCEGIGAARARTTICTGRVEGAPFSVAERSQSPGLVPQRGPTGPHPDREMQ